MGPRPIGRGETQYSAVIPCRGCALQWGRDQLVAERRVDLPWCTAARRASMGPRPIGRGELRIEHGSAPPGAPASMGPRPIGRGEAQWCRGSRAGVSRLQWGRDQLVAERRPIGLYTSPRSVGFNGAATNWSRRGASVRIAIRISNHASMGPRPIGRGEELDKFAQDAASELASMGPRPIGRGEASMYLLWLPHHLSLQWGRDQLVAERTSHNVDRLRSTMQASMGPRPIGRGEPLAADCSM